MCLRDCVCEMEERGAAPELPEHLDPGTDVFCLQLPGLRIPFCGSIFGMTVESTGESAMLNFSSLFVCKAAFC